MIEDDDYRASSQYRAWSFTKQRLDEIRQETNASAAEKLRAAFRRTREAQAQASVENSGNGTVMDLDDTDVEALSVEEELMIVEWGSDKIVQMVEVMERPIPSYVTATAIQFLRRFYLTNSPMTYHPRQITACALYMATKAEHCYIKLHRFVSALENVTEDDVKAPEFLLLQGLRFHLSVRHPMRGLEGGVAEITALSSEGRLKNLQRTVNGQTQAAAQRIGFAADKAKSLLNVAAQKTDAYFLYTPSQIWLAALLATDEDLAVQYVEYLCSHLGPAGADMKSKLLTTIRSCADLLSAYRSADEDSNKAKEIRKVGRKLNKFQNPEKLDIVAVTRAKAAEKRDGSRTDPEKALKKRKLERERLEKDGDVFGPDLKNIS